MKDLQDFKKPGLWLAVITRKQKIKVVATAKTPQKALETAQQAGFQDASLMMSSSRYASWAPTTLHEI